MDGEPRNLHFSETERLLMAGLRRKTIAWLLRKNPVQPRSSVPLFLSSSEREGEELLYRLQLTTPHRQEVVPYDFLRILELEGENCRYLVARKLFGRGEKEFFEGISPQECPLTPTVLRLFDELLPEPENPR